MTKWRVALHLGSGEKGSTEPKNKVTRIYADWGLRAMPEHHNHPLLLANRAASMRLAAPSLLIASDK
jgi:hypothetical protein